VHAHTDYQGGVALLAAQLAGIANRVSHSHSSGWGKGSGLRSAALLKALQLLIRVSATEYCACSSEAARFLFGAALVRQDKVQLLKNGIDVRQFTGASAGDREAVRQELGLPREAKVLGHIGRFSASKNHRFLLQVLERAVRRDDSFHAVLVGDGPLKEEIEAEADRSGLRSHIRFLGVRPDIPRLLSAFDVFVFPSIFEGFGIAALEAQCAGVPCVVSETVPAEVDMGLGLVTFHSLEAGPDVWAAAVLRSATVTRPDPETRARSISQLGFDISRNMRDWLSLYGIT
jgi:glycosyltransferase EpsF